MLKEKTLEFTDERKALASQGNLISVILVATRYLKDNDLNVSDFWQYIGRHFAKGWEDVEKGNIDEVVERIAINMASCGCDIQLIQSDEKQASLEIWGWPNKDLADFFSVSVEDAEKMLEVFRPIAASRGLDYEWHTLDTTQRLTIKA